MKRMFSLSLSLLACVALVLSLSACSKQPDPSSASTPSSSSALPKTTVNIQTIMGPTGIGMVHLMEQNKQGAAANDYRFSVASSPDQIGSKLLTGETDIAAIPTNVAATLYNKSNGQVTMLAVNTLGVLYILENGDTIKSVEDLRGKTIYSTGQGANPEYVLRYILSKNGIDPEKDVTIEFLSENEELAAALISDRASVALVPEPVVTTVQTKKASLRVALNMTQEWEAVAGADSQLMMGCVAARTAFVNEHPEAVAAFLQEYEASINAATAQLDQTAQLCVSHGIIANAAIAKAAIPRCNLTFVCGADMKTRIAGYYQVLMDANPKAIGGALPDDAFYYLP